MNTRHSSKVPRGWLRNGQSQDTIATCMESDLKIWLRELSEKADTHPN
jgi:hypothetical protein